MADYSYPTIFRIFQQDQIEQANELIDQNGIVSILGAAATYSTNTRQLSPQFSRRLLQSAVYQAYLGEFVYMADQIINQEKTPNNLEPRLHQQLDQECQHALRLAINHQDSDEAFSNFKANPEILKMVATSTPEALGQILHYICVENSISWLALGDGFRLTLIERTQRLLHDERTFWLLVRDAYSYETCATLIRQLGVHEAVRNAVQDEIQELQGSGYNVTELAPGVISLSVPQEETAPSQSAQDSGTRRATDEWLSRGASKRWRRNHSRRR